MTITTEPKILLAHYCAGRYPDHVPVGLPDDLGELSAAQLAEICVARAIGAYDMEHEHPELRPAHQVAEMVAGLLADEVEQQDVA